MPNWCENTLTIKASTSNAMKDYNRLESLFEDSLKIDKDTGYVDNLFNSIIPMPKELLGTEAPKEKPNWYNWRLEHWGTKWDVSGYLEYSDRDMLEYSFDSAWSPPSSFIEKVSKDFPLLRLRLKYDEPGMCFMGRAIAINGHLDDVSIEY